MIKMNCGSYQQATSLPMRNIRKPVKLKEVTDQVSDFHVIAARKISGLFQF